MGAAALGGCLPALLSPMLEEQALRGPVDWDRRSDEVIEREVGRLRSFEDCLLEIRRQEREADEAAAILGAGRVAADRKMAGIKIDHRVGALELPR